MKRTASIITIGTSAFFFLLALPVLAKSTVTVSNNGEGSHTSVNVESNTGGNTICQNGKCTTTSNGNGTSTVCVNGVCHESSDGTINYQSDDGNTKVNINSNTQGSTVTEDDEDDTKAYGKKVFPTPTTIKAVLGTREEAIAKKIAAQKEAKNRAEQERLALEVKKSSFQRFIEHEMAAIKNFFVNVFPF